MTTELRRSAGLVRTGHAAAVALALGGGACAGALENRHGDTLDVSSYPKEIQEAYPVFARRCSRCHSLGRPLSAQIDDPEHWRRYVKRMRLQPGSGINRKNGKIILRFLTFYATQARGDGAEAGTMVPAVGAPPSQPERTTTDSPDTTKGSAP